jgi:hypothetical protein
LGGVKRDNIFLGNKKQFHMPRLVKSSELNSNEYDHTIRSKNPEVLNKKNPEENVSPGSKKLFCKLFEICSYGNLRVFSHFACSDCRTINLII